MCMFAFFPSLMFVLFPIVQTKWRGPEEKNYVPLNEQVDVWSLGASMYALLTGRSPYRKLWKKKNTRDQMDKIIATGETDYIDPRFLERSYGEQKLVEVIRRTWEYDPDKRIDVFGIVKLLRKATEENKKHAKK